MNLTTNEDQSDFSKLVRFITILNNTPTASLADSLESVIEVSGSFKIFCNEYSCW